MGSALKLALSAAVYASVATVISQAIGVGYLWISGTFDRHKMRQIAAVISGVDMIPGQLVRSRQKASASLPISLEESLRQRATKSLDLDLREQAVEKGLQDLHALAMKLAEDTRRFDLRKETFNAALQELDEGAKNRAITEVRRTLEALRPRQAKDQLIRMLKNDEMQTVVTMIKAMPLDKRKKLLAEFRAGDEPDQLAEILKQILRGVPETLAIRAARQEAIPPAP